MSIVRVILPAVVAAFLAACGGGGSPGSTSIEDQACSAPGGTTCDNNNVYICLGGLWKHSRDCVESTMEGCTCKIIQGGAECVVGSPGEEGTCYGR